jgi:hypothetical protein
LVLFARCLPGCSAGAAGHGRHAAAAPHRQPRTVLAARPPSPPPALGPNPPRRQAIELAFLQRALQDPSLRPAQRLHSAAALAGMALFCVEDSVPHVPLVHSSWHLCSAAATNAFHALLADAEARQGVVDKPSAEPPARAARARARGGAALGLPPHAAAAAAAAAAAVAATAGGGGGRELVVSPLTVGA